jgi:hypothetical protein
MTHGSSPRAVRAAAAAAGNAPGPAQPDMEHPAEGDVQEAGLRAMLAAYGSGDTAAGAGAAAAKGQAVLGADAAGNGAAGEGSGPSSSQGDALVTMPGVSLARDLTQSVPGDDLPHRLVPAPPISATEVSGCLHHIEPHKAVQLAVLNLICFLALCPCHYCFG